MPAPSSPSNNSRTPPGGTGFPTGAFVAVACAAVALMGWHLWKKAPGGGGMPVSVFREAFALRFGAKPAVKVARTPLNGVQGSPEGPGPQPRPGSLPAISAVFVDDSGALDPFYAALWHLEQVRGSVTVARPGSAEPTRPGGKAAGTDGAPVPLTSFSADAGEKAAVMNGAPASVEPIRPDGKAVSTDGAPGSVGGGENKPIDAVTVLHYGDSPTTADLITGDARALLQARFGNAGHGFNLPAKPWAWYGHRDVTISDSGWHALTPVGSMREGVYGLGGATLVGSSGATAKFKLGGEAQSEVEVSYLREPGGGSFSVSVDDATLQTISTEGAADTPAWATVKLPAGTSEVELAVTGGTVKMLGVDFRTPRSGVLYDSMGLNGATTTVMARGFGKATWPVELQHARPALVVINYGTNESSFAAWVNKGYENELRLAVAKVRSALPDVPILIMSPMDRGKREGLNDIQTMDTIPQIVEIQKRVAAELHCGFFDTFDAMGGDGTMANWYNGKPRLVSADLIHPTPQGALIVAQKLMDNLMLGYDRWKRVHGIAVGPAVPASPAEKQKQNAKDAKSIAKGVTGGVVNEGSVAKRVE